MLAVSVGLSSCLGACGSDSGGSDATPDVWDAAPDGPEDASLAVTLDERERQPGGDTTTDELGEGAFVQEAANLSILRRGDFQAGQQFFRLEWVEAPGRSEIDGLGPTFNAISCIACHARNGRASPPADEAGPGVLLRLGSSMGASDPVYGQQLQPFGIAGVPGEGTVQIASEVADAVSLPEAVVELRRLRFSLGPLSFGPLAAGTRTSPRLAQQLVGLGLLEAIEVDDVVAFEDPNDADGDGVSGRAAWLQDGSLGRFGWKAAQATVASQSAAALFGDLGLTTSFHPLDNCPPAQLACREAPSGGEPEVNDVRLAVIAAYVRLLGVPARRNAENVLSGKALFARIGCGDCHRANFLTGPAQDPELADQNIWPYTDLLLHDMGPGLADGVPEGAANGSEWRTPPLWGLGLIEQVNGERYLLHDGRARTLAEAILWHGGEAQASRELYVGLTPEERAAIHEFVDSL
ncbi:MAG: di-heme oxidoredictase family protein [Myxococcota bacterium]